MNELIDYINTHPQGVSASQIAEALNLSRTTLNRRLREELERGSVTISGKGPATRYLSSDPLQSLRLYFEKPDTERTLAPYQEELLNITPALSPDTVKQLSILRGPKLDKRELTRFLIDFSCASSSLEGGTYSLLDTQALIEYGEKAQGKHDEDAFLVLNHKQAFEYLYDNPRLDTIFQIHDLLTSDHELPALADSRHFLTRPNRGVAREYNDVNIALSAYLPPFRPGTGYIGKMLERIMSNVQRIDNPIQAAFYLLTRLPYLQPFQDGNKRTSRALCNVPLLQAGLAPISFVDFAKRDYIVSLLAFYELGDARLAERSFAQAYIKSIARVGKRR
jgi:Fic family protein